MELRKFIMAVSVLAMVLAMAMLHLISPERRRIAVMHSKNMAVKTIRIRKRKTGLKGNGALSATIMKLHLLLELMNEKGRLLLQMAF